MIIKLYTFIRHKSKAKSLGSSRLQHLLYFQLLLKHSSRSAKTAARIPKLQLYGLDLS